MLDLTRAAQAFLKGLPAKQYKQLAARVLSLSRDHHPHDSRHVSGHPGYKRIDQGEYRIIFYVHEDDVRISYIGKRNDNDAYKELARR